MSQPYFESANIITNFTMCKILLHYFTNPPIILHYELLKSKHSYIHLPCECEIVRRCHSLNS